MSTENTPAKLLAHVMAAAIAMKRFHPDPAAREAGDIMLNGLGVLLAKILGVDEALTLLEECYEILNAGPLKGTGIHVTTLRKLKTDAHDTTEDLLAKLRTGGLI